MTTQSRYAHLTREQLSTLLPELLLVGHLIDRSGMAWCIQELGRDGMAQIAIEEWMAASPIYTRRMQRALRYEGDDVHTIIKGLQLDIGAPPQFMDFRYTITDRWHARFELAHCGALMDVEPMGPDYVRAMCHDIEDPTFDATAVATNPKAQLRPVHRPPRVPADRTPHCEWTIVIDDAHPEVTFSEGCLDVWSSRAANVELAPIVPGGPGLDDYSGPVLSDVDFTAFSHSALVRMADEVVLQMHLLVLGFARALRQRVAPEVADRIVRRQLIGFCGMAAHRLRQALQLPADPAGARAVLLLHPLLNPAAYVHLAENEEWLIVQQSPAHEDDGWLRRCGVQFPQALHAVVQAVDAHLTVEVAASDEVTDSWRMRVLQLAEPAAEPDEVAITRLSTGAAFSFGERRSLPIVAV